MTFLPIYLDLPINLPPFEHTSGSFELFRIFYKFSFTEFQTKVGADELLLASGIFPLEVGSSYQIR